MDHSSPYLSDSHHQFRNSIRQFIKKEIVPEIKMIEEQEFIHKKVWKKLAEQNLLGLYHPKEQGGGERDLFYSMIFLEELGRICCAGIRISIALHAYMATSYLALFASKALKDDYLTLAVQGKKIAALAISEQQAGSDLSKLTTTASYANQHYTINGNKKYVANGEIADFIILIAKTSDETKSSKRGTTGLSMFVVDTNLNGITCKKYKSLGIHSANVVELNFNNVIVPENKLVGEANNAFFYLMRGLQLERLVTAAAVVGEIDACIERTWAYMSQRKLYDGTQHQLQALRHKMAAYKSELEIIRHYVYHTAWLFEQGNIPIVECSIAKLKATELLKQVASNCLQFHGAHGCLEENFIARVYRDAAIATIGAGASEVMLDIIAQLALDDKTVTDS